MPSSEKHLPVADDRYAVAWALPPEADEVAPPDREPVEVDESVLLDAEGQVVVADAADEDEDLDDDQGDNREDDRDEIDLRYPPDYFNQPWAVAEPGTRPRGAR